MYFSIQRETIITSLFRKLIKKVSRKKYNNDNNNNKKKKKKKKNFKIQVNGISDPLEMFKNIISALIHIDKPIGNVIPYCRKTGSISITQVLP